MLLRVLPRCMVTRTQCGRNCGPIKRRCSEGGADIGQIRRWRWAVPAGRSDRRQFVDGPRPEGFSSTRHRPGQRKEGQSGPSARIGGGSPFTGAGPNRSDRRAAQARRNSDVWQGGGECLGRASESWRNAKHRGQWLSTLQAYAFPHFGDVAVSEIEGPEVGDALVAIWLEKPEPARRVRQRIVSVIDWATLAPEFGTKRVAARRGVQPGKVQLGHLACRQRARSAAASARCRSGPYRWAVAAESACPAWQARVR